jgi:protoporphyrinogen oxidase
VAPGYAPPGHSLVSATVLGDEPVQEQELLRRVRRQLGGWFGADAVDAWRHLATYRIHHAQPAQPPGFRASRPDSPRLRRGVYLAGDWMTDASINGALLAGRHAAEALLADR